MIALDISCTSIRTLDTMEFERWLDGIPNFKRGCMEMVQAACLSPEAFPVDMADTEGSADREDPADRKDPPDRVDPADMLMSMSPELPQRDGGGGCACAIASNAGAGETSKGIVLNLILVMSVLLVIPWRNHSKAKKT